MKLSDVSRLRKFMALTTSDNDAESLAALRQANKLLAANNLTWANVFDRTIKPEVTVEEVEHVDTPRSNDLAPQIEDALQKVLEATKPGSFRNFILDLEAKWQERHYLTKGQRDALFAAARRA